MNKTLLLRLGLCLLSGTLVGMAQGEIAFFNDIGEPAVYVVSGVIFAAAVLFPYLNSDRQFLWRAPGLAVISWLSYHAAVLTALDAPFVRDELLSFTVASIVGAAIVLLPFALLAGVNINKNLFFVGSIAAVVGGPVTRFTLMSDYLVVVIVGHTVWHALIALSLWFGTVKSRSSDHQEFFGGRLFSSI